MKAGAAPTLPRVNDGWLSGPERRAIDWIAPRLPGWLLPNHLTALGIAAAAVACLGYILAARAPAWLWVVNFALATNWFADSLDGAVARLRHLERPRFGFFLDQSVDVLSQLLFALGLGLSVFIRMEVVAIGLATYLMMTVQGLLRAEVRRVFHLASGGMGLTEVRCLFLFVNALFYFVPPTSFEIAGRPAVYGDVLGSAWIVANLIAYLRTMVAELRSLHREEGPPK